MAPRTPKMLRFGASLGAIGLLSVAPVTMSRAQSTDEPGGVVLDLAVSQTVSASDNADLTDPAEGEIVGITSLDGSIASITRTRSFTLGFQLGVEYGGIEGFQLGNSGVDLSYMMMGPGSELEVFADYFRRNVTDEIDLDDDPFLEDLTLTTGTRVSYGYGARVLFGADGPLSFAARAAQREIEFDTDDPDAIDTSTLSVSGSVTARLDPATTGRVTASFVETEEDDADNTVETTTSAGIGLTRELGAATTVSVDLDWEEVRTAAATTEVESGLGGRLAFDRELPAGSFGASAERDITVNGPIDTFRVNRQFELPASSLGLDAGIVITDGDTVSPLLGVSYERLSPDTVFNLSLTQDADLNGDDETVLNTVGTASIRRDINAVSSIGASLTLSNQDVIGIDDTTRRVTGSLTYDRALTDDVSLTTGYEHRRIFETGSDERVSNTVFVTVSRSFSRRP